MATEDFKRKLTAIFSADVAGYSRLMGEDEAATVKTLANYREVMASLIKQHRGRVIDSPGDNVLAEFVSVVDAVQCAVTVQRELQTRNAELPENRRMEFRIGINLGDVIDEEDRIYGDGVNIAARLEALADPGGICISKTAFDQIETKLPLGYEFLGEQDVKNIAKPVGAYRVLMDAEAAGKVIGEVRPKTKQLRGVAIGAVAVLIIVAGALAIWNFYLRPAFEPASVEKMAFPLPDKPSIAVLSFENMSDDPKQEYFSDGITENIITALSKVHNMFVIARNSTFTYKGRAVKIQQVAEELGVRYVLEGSVQKTEDRVRITAQLIDAITGNHLWAERYDRDLKDIFALQDEITKKIITSLHVKLTVGEDARLYGQTTDNFEAYLKFLQGTAHLMRLNKDATILARQMFKEAIALDANFIFAYVNLAWTHAFDAAYGWAKSRVKSLEAAEELAHKALSLDDSFAGTYGVLGSVQMQKGNLKEAVALREKAIALEPNSANYHALLGISLLFMGDRIEQAIKELKFANRLDPFPPNWILHYLGEAYRVNGEYERAIAIYKKTIVIEPDYWLSHLSLSACYGLLGHHEEAQAAAAEVLRIDPNFSIKRVMLAFRDKSDKKRTFEALRKAGLPESPPLPLPDKPSIAVLPFVNMSGDPEQEYFSDGITAQIITGLSKVPKLFVIARTSSFKYKGREVDVRKVGRELGVRYVLEGSVQRSENRLRITAQLIDAIKGHHLWSERYDRELKDIFALQDDITMKIIVALEVKLTEGEKARIAGKQTDNLQAYEKYLQASGHYYRLTKEGIAQARTLLEEAIDLDPEFAAPYLLLGTTHYMDISRGASKNPRESIKRAFELINKAIALDDSYAGAHSLLGWLYIVRERNYDKAIAQCERALNLEPNLDIANIWMGLVLTFAGRHEEAVRYCEQAVRLSPIPTAFSFRSLGLAYSWVGRYEEAIATHKKALQRAANDIVTHLHLTTAYGWAGRLEEARFQAAEVLRINPNYCNKRGKGLYKNPADMELVNNARREAGIPDCPPRRGSK